MAERTRERTREPNSARNDMNDFETGLDRLREMRETTTAEDSRGNAATTSAFVPPTWLKGLFPIRWTQSDGCRKTDKRGQNCCLFYPLGYCQDMDVINGFCVFHLRALFNLVYQTDCVYMMNAQNKPVMSQRTACYVSEPQIINDEYTAIFPVMELFQDREIQLKDIKLHNLFKHLQLHGTRNWERIYTNHVNYLYRMFTMFTPKNMAHLPIEARIDQLASTQLMMHWTMWNEYHSNLLVENPADITAFYVGTNVNEVRPLPLNQCTTITQMIARLFGEPYTSLNEQRFFSTVPPYGIYVWAHWSYANNLCSIGTHCTKGNLPCIGNIATLNMLRLDAGSCYRSTVHYSKINECGSSYCVSSKLNLEAPSLNQTVIKRT